MKILEDAWLAQFLSPRAYRVVPSNDGHTTSRKNLCTQPGFYYAKVDTARLDHLNSLAAAGFQVVDVNLTFERQPAGEACPRPAPSDLSIRPPQPADHEALLAIAASCFKYSRFHLDPWIPQATADAIKRSWVENYLLGRRGESLWVAERAGRPVAFLCLLAAPGESGTVRIIDLVGVAPAYQGQGVGRSLVDFFITSSYPAYQLLRVGTQVANIPSVRLYETCGFRLAASTYVLHAHIATGGTAS
jgi:ribosomal protein S18 acetylase RimI-like enzyme